MKRARGLKVIGSETDHNISATPYRKPTKFPSAEIKGDAAWPVEPPNFTAADLDDPRRRSWLQYRAALVLRGSFDPKPGTPKTRADCPPDRALYGCAYVACRHFLWRREEPPGRPGLERVPRGMHGHTVSLAGELASKDERQAVLDAKWLQHPPPASCSLDVADSGPHDNEALGDITGNHRTLIARVVNRAALSLKERGVDARDLMRLTSPDLREDAEPSRVTIGRRRRS